MVPTCLLSAYTQEGRASGTLPVFRTDCKREQNPRSLGKGRRSLTIPGQISITGQYAPLWPHSRSKGSICLICPETVHDSSKSPQPSTPLPSAVSKVYKPQNRARIVGNHIPGTGSHTEMLVFSPVHFPNFLSAYSSGKSENRKETSQAPTVQSHSKTRESSLLVLHLI